MKPESCVNGGVERRVFLHVFGAAAGLMAGGCATSQPSQVSVAKPHHHDGTEISPGEDLMREHGVLGRILLIYEEAARRIDLGDRFDDMTLAAAAKIVRRFIEDYHDKNEEQFVFPRLQAAQHEANLVPVLARQHQRGREVTDDILAKAGQRGGPDTVKQLRGFSRMARSHVAREDTLVFPALRQLIGPEGYREMGEQFEDKRRELLGAEGFEATLAEIARLEQSLEMADLAKFTMP